MASRTTPVLLCALLFAAGCSPERQMARAKALEKDGQYYKAWEKYQEVATLHAPNPVAPEAVFRAGWVAQHHLEDCFMASTFYDEVLTRYPDAEPWARAALLQKNSCPDYFPLVVGSVWTEVDSDTKGNNARVEIVCQVAGGTDKELPTQSGKFVKSYFAGNKKSISAEIVYKKDQQDLLEMRPGQENSPTVLLKWPIEVGAKWLNRVDGRNINYQVSSMDEKISVVAGDFTQCLQVRSVASGDSVVKNEYYAPGVGRILTSISTEKGEKRITELAGYKIADAPDFSPEEKKP